MKILVENNNEAAVLHVTGRIDTYTSEEFERELMGAMGREVQVIIDFKEVEYISSAGLRVLLNGQKKANNEDKELICRCINEVVEEVFESTGFIDILTVE